MALKIRKLEREDFEQVLAMWENMMAESPEYKDEPFDRETSQAILTTMITSWVGDYLGLVAEDDGQLVGMLGAVVNKNFFNSTKYTMDFAVYVVPERRGGTVSIRMIREYEEWVRKKGIKKCTLGVSTGLWVERTVSLYSRLGYKLVSYNMEKKL